MSFRVLTRAMNLYPYQQLYFTSLEYGSLTGIFNDRKRELNSISENENVMLLTGIASPEQIIKDINPFINNINHLKFADHHEFNAEDAVRINQEFERMEKPRMIITTEKDAARLLQLEGLSDDVRNNIYALPVEVKIMLDQEEKFNQNIINYVHKNSRNSILVKNKNDHKPQNSNNTGDRPRTISFRNN